MEEIRRILTNDECLDITISAEDVAASPMRNFYKDKSVLLTGATGFIGQLLLEKLLRCEVKMIYVLARSKKDKPPLERLKQMFDTLPFAKIKKYYPNFLSHVSVIEGDLAVERLGINSADLYRLEGCVEIILHAAADVRFSQSLYDLVLTNLRGTRELLALAENFTKLQVFNYVSTAYSHCPRSGTIREQFYEAPIEIDAIISFVAKCSHRPEDLKMLEILTDRLIGVWPNTYSFSKSLSEELVRRHGDRIPICVVRPSIVISTYQEPLPGWCNTVFGITGAFVAGGTGLLRVLDTRGDASLDLVCADFVVNAILAATWATHENAKSMQSKGHIETNHRPVPKPKIYAITTNTTNTSIKYIGKHFSPLVEKYPLTKMIWINNLTFTGCPFLYKYLTFYCHFLVAVLLDVGFKISRAKLRLLPIARKCRFLTGTLSYFMNHQWTFDQSNMHDVCAHMHPVDKRLFPCDTRVFDFKSWIPTYTLGMLKYLIKEPLTDLEAARKKRQLISYLHAIVLLAFYSLQIAIIYLLAKGFGLVGYAENIYNSFSF